MSDAIGFKGVTNTYETPAAKPLDEIAWEAWKARGRARDRRGREDRIRALKCGSIVALLALTAFWSQLTSYEVVIRSVLAAAAFGMMLEEFKTRQYAFAAVFAGLALLYNPVAPVIDFSGNWQRALVFASAIPFVSSLAWPNPKEARLD
jgi:hypothetical protein